MKKIFLIPLLTLMCSVMAWGTDVANLATLRSTIQGASAGSTVNVRLTANISGAAASWEYDDWGNSANCLLGVIVNLDLNGHTLAVNSAEYDTYTAFIAGFTFDNNWNPLYQTTLNLTNSSNTAATFGYANNDAYTVMAYGNVTYDNNINIKGMLYDGGWSADGRTTFKENYSGIVTGSGYAEGTIDLEDGCQGKFCDAFKETVSPF